MDEEKCLVYKDRIYIPNNKDVQNLVLDEMH